jgi:hypothetical protein
MNKGIKIIFLIISCLIWAGLSMAGEKAVPKATSAGEQIKWQVLSEGGVKGASTNYKLDGTIGQTAVAPGTSSSYKINNGYWQNFVAGGCCVLGGDANHDGKRTLLDVLYILNKLYREGPDFVCATEADANADGKYTMLDVLYIINALYRGGPKPTCP